MPLRVSRRPDTGTLWITGTVRAAGAESGARIRQRAGTDVERLAREEAAALEAKILRDWWHGKKPGTKGFPEAVASYLMHEPRSTGTQALLTRLVLHFRDTPLAEIKQEAVDRARVAVLRPDASPGTVRRNLIVPLRAVLLHAARRDWCTPPRFDIPAEPKGRTKFLLPGHVDALLAGAAPHLRPLLRFLVCTGCRMSEALALQWGDVDLIAARVILWEGETKGGNRRVVDLSPAAVTALSSVSGRAEHVFRMPSGDRYRDSEEYGGQIKSGWSTACRNAGLPGETRMRKRAGRKSAAAMFAPEFTPHDLRHTWATWHYAVHRDLLLLKQAGGWSKVDLVERYAHIMPAGHEAGILAAWGIVTRGRHAKIKKTS